MSPEASYGGVNYSSLIDIKPLIRKQFKYQQEISKTLSNPKGIQFKTIQRDRSETFLTKRYKRNVDKSIDRYSSNSRNYNTLKSQKDISR